MNADETVVLRVVPDEPEAVMLCDFLRSAGFECGYRDTEATDSPLEGFTASGPREVIVHESELEAVRAALAESGR